MPRVGHDDASASQLIGLLGRELSVTHHKDRLFVEQLSDLVCRHLLREHSVRSDPKCRLSGGLTSAQLSRVIDFMTAQLAEPIGLQDLSSIVGLSRGHFCTAFKASTGMQPYAWLIAHRMTRAQSLLETSPLPIASVSTAVGYQDPGYFARLFRKHVSETPLQYRIRRSGRTVVDENE